MRRGSQSALATNLRSATQADLHAVASWIASPRDCELWAGFRVAFPIDMERLPQAIEFSDANSFCLQESDTVVAFGQIITKARRAHLARLIVKPSARGRGYGRRLVEHLLDRVPRELFDRASLNVDASNVPAVSLYLSLGFRDAPRPEEEPASAGARYMERAMDRTRFEGVMPVSAVSAFLAALPADRRPEVERVREEVLRHLPDGYEEVVSRNMLVYQVPLERYPDTYNGHPLWYVALASEKSYLSLHLMPVYGDKGLAARLASGFKTAGKRLDMGKACVRFKKADDLALDAIGDIVAAVPVDRWVQMAQQARRR